MRLIPCLLSKRVARILEKEKEEMVLFQGCDAIQNENPIPLHSLIAKETDFTKLDTVVVTRDSNIGIPSKDRDGTTTHYWYVMNVRFPSIIHSF